MGQRRWLMLWLLVAGFSFFNLLLAGQLWPSTPRAAPTALVGLSVAWLGLTSLLGQALWRWPGLVSNLRVSLLFKGIIVASGIVMLIISVMIAVLAMLVGLLFLTDPGLSQD